MHLPDSYAALKKVGGRIYRARYLPYPASGPNSCLPVILVHLIGFIVHNERFSFTKIATICIIHITLSYEPLLNWIMWRRTTRCNSGTRFDNDRWEWKSYVTHNTARTQSKRRFLRISTRGIGVGPRSKSSSSGSACIRVPVVGLRMLILLSLLPRPFPAIPFDSMELRIPSVGEMGGRLPCRKIHSSCAAAAADVAVVVGSWLFPRDGWTGAKYTRAVWRYWGWLE